LKTQLEAGGPKFEVESDGGQARRERKKKKLFSCLCGGLVRLVGVDYEQQRRIKATEQGRRRKQQKRMR